MVYKICAHLVLLGLVIASVSCTTHVEDDFPNEIIECIQLIQKETGEWSQTNASTENIYARCLQQFLWKTENVQWSGFNITQKDREFINSLIESLARSSRTKRQASRSYKKSRTSYSYSGRKGRTFPETGFRVRREYRRLSDSERSSFHAAINQMKKTGQYDTFANLHTGMVLKSAHGGPNFLGWHRVYLALFEEALRRINPKVSLPYWDSTLDFDMDNPVNSIIWTESFLGNGDGFVTTGPFANWNTSVGRLTRNVGSDSTLFYKTVIQTIMTRCRIRDITEPTAQPKYSLEFAHNGPHIWVGGQLSGLETAAHDPTFFMLHAFVDYIWEMFRERQTTLCMVNPSTDYPSTPGEHAAERTMDGFPRYRNIDGYRAYWTQSWYRYESSPTCSLFRPYCGTPYLRCNVRQQRCISVSRRDTAQSVGIDRIFDGTLGSTLAAGTSESRATQAQAEESTIKIGRRFKAPPAEKRTLAATRLKRALKDIEEHVDAGF